MSDTTGKVRLTPASHPIDAEVTVEGSKSYTNRALVIASLAAGESRILGASTGDDTRILVDALRCFGVEIRREDDALVVRGTGAELEPYQGELDLGLAGTSYRFLVPLVVLARGSDVVLTGSARMRERPVADLVDALRQLGARIDYLETEGCPPLRVRGTGPVSGGTVNLSPSVSSQFLTAILMVAPLADGALCIHLDGPLRSRSYVDMTVECMEDFGVPVSCDENGFSVDADQRYHPGTYTVDGDASAASYFWGIAAISGGRVRVRNLRAGSPQGDLRFATILEEMGCQVSEGEDDGVGWIEVRGTDSLVGVTVDMSSLPDTAQSLAVVAALGKGETHIDGLHSLVHKETDRLGALHAELGRVGITSRFTESSITVQGGEPRPACIETYGDHRMAMSLAILGVRVAGLEIRDPDVVSKSFPGFWDQLSRIGVGVEWLS